MPAEIRSLCFFAAALAACSTSPTGADLATPTDGGMPHDAATSKHDLALPDAAAPVDGCPYSINTTPTSEENPAGCHVLASRKPLLIEIRKQLEAEAVEIGMEEGKGMGVVTLRERKGRARHFERFILGKISDHGACGRGLAGAEIARQRDDVAGTDQQRKVGHQLCGCGLIRQCDQECQRISHSAALRCAA